MKIVKTPTQVSNVDVIDGKPFVFYDDPDLRLSTFKNPRVSPCLLKDGDNLEIIKDENTRFLGLFGQACVGCVFAKIPILEGGCQAVYRK